MLDGLSEILTIVENIIIEIRRQNYANALQKQIDLSEKLLKVAGMVPEVHSEELFCVLFEIMNAQTREDYVLYADLLELNLLPFLSKLTIEFIGDNTPQPNEQLYSSNLNELSKRNHKLYEICQNYDKSRDDIVVEFSSSGYLTCRIGCGEDIYYLHSNANPVIEAEIFANQYYNTSDDCYVVFGLGLGYHIQAMLNLDDGIYIDVIEPNIGMLIEAMKYVDMRWLWMNKRIRLIYDSNYSAWQESLKKCQTFAIHYPSMQCVQDETIKLQLQKFFVRDSGMRKYKNLFKSNFRENILNCDAYVDELKTYFEGKNAILVAAGPSLDKNIELVRNLPPNTLLIVVGTVYKKLINMEISPDCVVFLDSQPRNIRQINGLNMMEIPIIIASTATKKIGSTYSGKKYLVCQRGYDKAEEYAQQHDYSLYESGGSVSTIMLDICIRLGCKEMAFIGLDLAYTMDKSHSDDTLDKRIVDSDEDVCTTISSNGEIIKTSKLFLIYKEWMEKRALEPDAKGKLIDATEGGAYLENWRMEPLDAVLSGWKNKV